MTTNHAETKAAIKEYILDKFLPGEDPDELEDDTPLITAGILDSISTVRLVAFLEKRFGIAFRAHELNADYLNTISKIAETIASKQQ